MNKGPILGGALVGAVTAIILGVPSFTVDIDTVSEPYLSDLLELDSVSLSPPLLNFYCESLTLDPEVSCNISVIGIMVVVIVLSVIGAGVGALFIVAFGYYRISPSKVDNITSNRIMNSQQGVARYGQISDPKVGDLRDTKKLIEHRNDTMKAIQKGIRIASQQLEQLEHPVRKELNSNDTQLIEAQETLNYQSKKSKSLQIRIQSWNGQISADVRSLEASRTRFNSLNEELKGVQENKGTLRGKQRKQAELRENRLEMEIKDAELRVKLRTNGLRDGERKVNQLKEELEETDQLIREAKQLVEKREQLLTDAKQLEMEQLPDEELANNLMKAKQLVSDSAGWLENAKRLADKLAEDTTIPQPVVQHDIIAGMLRTTQELVEECAGQLDIANQFVEHFKQLRNE